MPLVVVFVTSFKRPLHSLDVGCLDNLNLSLAQAQDPADTGSWETRYILLLWLSIIAMIPFDISRLPQNECRVYVTVISGLIVDSRNQ